MATCSTAADFERKATTAGDHVFEMQYADDTAMPSHVDEGVQQNSL